MQARRRKGALGQCVESDRREGCVVQREDGGQALYVPRAERCRLLLSSWLVNALVVSEVWLCGSSVFNVFSCDVRKSLKSTNSTLV
jgi:hypothetical protein